MSRLGLRLCFPCVQGKLPMKRVILCGLLLTIMCLARPVCANIVINVGNISLAPNEANQQREIYVSTDSGATSVQGLEFYVRVGAGDGPVIGPTISGLDVVGDSTLFSSNNSGLTYSRHLAAVPRFVRHHG